MRMTVNLLGVCSMVVLARLLTPEDFGLVALAGTAYSFFSLLGQFGFDIHLIQMQNADRSYYDSAWTANILVGLAIAAAMLLVARPAAIFFQDARIENVVYCFSVLSLAKGFENIGVVNFRKNLTFGGEFFYFVVPKIASVVIGVAAAIVLRTYWALVIGMLAAQITTLLYSHFSQPFRPRLSLSKVSELFSFTKWILGSRVLRYVTYSGVEIILGRLRGPQAVGLFGIASEVAHLPANEIAAPINRALFPSFSTIANDPARLRSAFGKVVAFTALIALPAALGIVAVSESLIYVVFGERWMPAVPVLTVLALVGILEATNTLADPVLMSRGAVRSMMFVLVGHVVVLIPAAIYFVDLFGAIGAAYGMLLGALAALPMYYYAVRAEIGIRAIELLRTIWRPLTAALLMAACVKQLEGFLVGAGDPTIPILITLVVSGALVYFVALLALWGLSGRPAYPERDLIQTLMGQIKARRPA